MVWFYLDVYNGHYLIVYVSQWEGSEIVKQMLPYPSVPYIYYFQ